MDEHHSYGPCLVEFSLVGEVVTNEGTNRQIQMALWYRRVVGGDSEPLLVL